MGFVEKFCTMGLKSIDTYHNAILRKRKCDNFRCKKEEREIERKKGIIIYMFNI